MENMDKDSIFNYSFQSKQQMQKTSSLDFPACLSNIDKITLWQDFQKIACSKFISDVHLLSLREEEKGSYEENLKNTD